MKFFNETFIIFQTLHALTFVCQTWLENLFSFSASLVDGLTLPAPNYKNISKNVIKQTGYLNETPGIERIALHL